MGITNPVFSLFGTEAQSFGLLDPKLCYLLDGILFIYGVIVTALFLREKVGSPGLLRDDVGSSTRRMCGRALALESLRPGLCSVSMGKTGDRQAGAVGGRCRWVSIVGRCSRPMSQGLGALLGCEAPMASAGNRWLILGSKDKNVKDRQPRLRVCGCAAN